MSSHKHVDSTLIDRVGKENVRAAFGLSAQALHNWRVRGIPRDMRIAFARLCAEKLVPTPDDFFEVFERKDVAA